MKLKNKDVLVITQKIISKSENRLIHKNNVIPMQSAKKLSKEIGKSSVLTQLILDESQRIIKKKHGVIITETNHGFIMLVDFQAYVVVVLFYFKNMSLSVTIMHEYQVKIVQISKQVFQAAIKI